MDAEPKPRTLQASCVIGGVFLPKMGSVSGTHARDRVQKDPSNLIPATFYHKTDQDLLSQRLGSVPQSAGGLMPEVNLEIGAPKATFAYAAISYDEDHPNLNLIRAAQVSRIDPSIVYDLNTSKNRADISQTVGDGSAVPPSPPETLSFPSPQYPFIPSVKTAKFSSESSKLTYNIWHQIKDGDVAALNKLLDYQIYYGVTNYLDTNIQMAHLNTNIDSMGGASITVHAQGQNTILERIFPLADDLVYEPGAKLFYPDANTQAVAPVAIKAKGGENCGFWLHFDHSDIPPQTKSDGSRATGGIIINWGAPAGGGNEHAIRNFSLVLLPGQTPKLYYLRPTGVSAPSGSSTITGANGDVWIEFALNGNIFGGGAFDVFVHYVGPNMLIGFDSDTNGWNAFTPQDFTQSYDAYYEPRIPSNARIAIVFSNVMSTFTYSPICFNNYHPENLVGGKEHRGFVNVNFSVPQSEAGFADEGDINAEFQQHRSPPTQFDSTDKKTQPTIYGDWRRAAGDAELFYQQQSSQKVGVVEGYQDIAITGKVFFDTTIEGPQFMHIRNFRPDDAARTQSGVVRPVWGKDGDVSEYLSRWRVTATMEQKNSSVSQVTADVTLKNIANTEIGAQIVNALNENVLTVTLAACYNDGPKATFFQGVIENVVLHHTTEGTELVLSCTDIATRLLNDIRFNNVLRFGGRTLVGIITDCIDMSGFGDWFRLRAKQTTTFDAFYAALERNLAFLSYQGSLAYEAMYASRQKFISDVLYHALSLVIAPNILPALYWNPEAGTLNLSERGELPIDELFFVGINSPDNIHLLPNNFDDREHGVVRERWSEATDVSTLASGVFLYGTNFYGRVITYQKQFSDALGEAAFAALNGLVGGSGAQNVVGYTGYNKDLLFDEDQAQLGSQNAMNELGDSISDIARTTYTKLNCDVYVTRPLTHMGKFRILSFQGGSDPYVTSEYYYKRVDYELSIDQNTITAAIEGERFPRFFSLGPR